MSQLIKTEITLGRLVEAGDHIQSIVENYPATYHDIKIGLKCKWEAAQGNFENALGLWEKLRNKERLVHKALRRQAMVGLLAQIDLADPRRDAYEREVERLTAELAPHGIPALEANWGDLD
jgi:hypothetical protein